ncbi:TetR/AcrR family transcriptional regulator [Iodidimonas sp. SYSU 1G8]|uniref:TetR/AcrR family transcriptional regulator n=1 Tax=Iodidimonas sp. SYSU 1G8 TaxID=3133967 RepID=UPI0031FEFF65
MSTSARANSSTKQRRAKGVRDGAYTRERILDEATRLIAERGFRNTTMKSVAASVGVTEPAVYRHFDGKEELLVAVFAEAVSRVLRPVARDTSGPAIEGIGRQLTLLMSPDQSTLRRLIAEMYAAALVEPKVAILAKEFIDNASSLLISELGRAIEEGDAAPDLNLTFARASLHIFMTGLAHHETLANDLIGDKAWADFIDKGLRKFLAG